MAEVASKTTALSSDAAEQRELVFDKFRRWGYLAARLDPLGFFSAASPAELDDKSPWSSEARSIYCGTIGADFMHIADPDRREWIAARMEHPPAAKPRPTAHSRAAPSRRTLRANSAGAFCRNQALFARRNRCADSFARSRRGSGRSLRRRADGYRDEPSRAAQRDGAHRRPSHGRDFCRLRRRRPAQRVRRRRRQVSRRRHWRISHGVRTQRRSSSRLESESLGSRGSGGDGPRARQTGAHWPARPAACAAGHSARRRRLRRAGNLGRNAQSRRSFRLHRRRHDSRHRQ